MSGKKTIGSPVTNNSKVIPVLTCLFSVGFGTYVIFDLWNSYNKLIECESKESKTCLRFTCPGENTRPVND